MRSTIVDCGAGPVDMTWMLRMSCEAEEDRAEDGQNGMRDGGFRIRGNHVHVLQVRIDERSRDRLWRGYHVREYLNATVEVSAVSVALDEGVIGDRMRLQVGWDRDPLQLVELPDSFLVAISWVHVVLHEQPVSQDTVHEECNVEPTIPPETPQKEVDRVLVDLESTQHDAREDRPYPGQLSSVGMVSEVDKMSDVVRLQARRNEDCFGLAHDGLIECTSSNGEERRIRHDIWRDGLGGDAGMVFQDVTTTRHSRTGSPIGLHVSKDTERREEVIRPHLRHA